MIDPCHAPSVKAGESIQNSAPISAYQTENFPWLETVVLTASGSLPQPDDGGTGPGDGGGDGDGSGLGAGLGGVGVGLGVSPGHQVPPHDPQLACACEQ